MALEPGRRLGQFEILASIGAGGMGQVYRARDAKLGRDVAIKVLPEDLPRHTERLARFEREARVLASLDHPNIGALYDFQREGDIAYLVLQLVEGDTLSERLSGPSLSLPELLDVFSQIAAGLEVAHAKGVVHRDLKPDNIKFDSHGHVKILDFGLAAIGGDESSTSGSKSASSLHNLKKDLELTSDGSVLGTPAYMSPEQSRGEKLDAKTDIWSFGCCLFEALCGRSTFTARTMSELMLVIQEREPRWEELPSNTSSELKQLLRRCLDKDPKQRYSSIADIRLTLHDLASEHRNERTEESSRVLTLVFTDLADSTELKFSRGDSAVRNLIRRHRAHVTQLADECKGRVIDWAGDGCFLTFETSTAGVQFSLRLQETHQQVADLPGVRVGLHLGEISESEGPDGTLRIEGLAVDIAARISGLAQPAQVLMSAAVYQSARQRLDADSFVKPVVWKSHGGYSLKGFDEPIDIGEAGFENLSPLRPPEPSEKARPISSTSMRKFRPVSEGRSPLRFAVPMGLVAIICLVAGLTYFLGSRNPALPPDSTSTVSTAITSIAVLPFENLSDEGTQDFFADGMTETLASELAKIRALTIASRTSSKKYRNTEKNISDIGRELNVSGVVEGSVMREGDEVRIIVSLFDARDGVQVWSRQYDDTITNVFKLHSEVALAIASEVEATLLPVEESRISKITSVDPRAVDFYFRGIEAIAAEPMTGFFLAVRYYDQALEIDPNFYQCWGAKSVTHALIAGLTPGMMEVHVGLASEAAENAIKLAPDEMGGYFGRFMVHLFGFDWFEAKKAADKAYACDPNASWSNLAIGVLEYYRGDYATGFYHLNRSFQLNPTDPLALTFASGTVALSDRADRAVEIARHFVDLDPNIGIMQAIYGYVAALAGLSDVAQSAAERGLELTNNSGLARGMQTAVFALSGEVEKASAIGDELFAKPGDPSAKILAGGYFFFMGDFDSYLDRVEAGLDAKDSQTVPLLRLLPFAPLDHGPDVKELIADDRYWELIDKLNYPPFPETHPAYEHQQRWETRKTVREELAGRDASHGTMDSFVVLPFDNVAADDSQDYFADGMTGALITELSKISALKVVGRSSSMHYRNSNLSPVEIARELAVNGIVTGTAFRSGGAVRISAELMDARTQQVIWSDNYDNSIENVLKLHSEVALAIAKQVEAAVTPEEAAHIADTRAVDPEAYDLYLRGREAFDGTIPGAISSIRFLDQAVALAAEFAEAWTHKGITHAAVASFVPLLYDTQSVLAMEAANRAIDLAPDTADAYFGRSYVQLGSFDWYGAKETADIAYAIDPNSPLSNLALGMVWVAQGDRSTATTFLERAYRLDPYSPYVALMTAVELGMNGDSNRSLEIFDAAIAQHPEDIGLRAFKMIVLFMDERFEEAQETAKYLQGSMGGDVIYQLTEALLFAQQGQMGEVLRLEARFNETSAQIYSSEMAGMFYLLAMGDVEQALDHYERGMERPNLNVLNQIRVSAGTGIELSGRIGRIYNDLLSQDRYWQLIDRMNFPPFPNDHPAYDAQQRWEMQKAARAVLDELQPPENGLIDSVVVLPFVNTRTEAEQEYFVDGMTSALTAELSQISALRVISRMSALRYKGTDMSPREIAAELNVDALIEGTVLRIDNDVRINVSLINAANESTIWNQTYDNTIENVFKLHSDVALAIASEVEAALTPEEAARIAKVETVDPLAYDLYLRGLVLHLNGTIENAVGSIQLFEQSLERDPDFVSAWSAKAISHLIAAQLVPPTAVKQHNDLAQAAAGRALELAPTNAEALFSRFAALMGLGDWYAAQETAQTVIRLAPQRAESNLAMGMLEALRGDVATAKDYLDRAYELDPDGQLTLTYLMSSYGAIGDTARSVEITDRAIRINPNLSGLLVLKALVIAKSGDLNAANEVMAEFEATVGGSSGLIPFFKAVVLATAGRIDEARQAEGEIAPLLESPAFPPDMAALYYIAIRDFDKALDSFERALDNLTMTTIWNLRGLVWDSNGPLFAPEAFTDSDRYWQLIDQMSFPPFPGDHPAYDAQQRWEMKKAARVVLDEQRTLGTRDSESLVVLPFDNMMDDLEQDFFVDGMTDTLISELSKIGALKVISRTTAMRYKNSAMSAKEIAAELEVDSLVEGSVMRIDDDVRITVSLINGRDETSLWNETYDNKVENVFQLHSNLALAVANEIEATIAPEEHARITKYGTYDSKAIDMFLQGNAALNANDGAAAGGVFQALRFYDSALAIEPDFYRCWSQKSAIHASLAFMVPAIADAQLELASNAADRAIALAPDDSMGYSSRFFVHMVNMDWYKAKEAADKSHQFDPNSYLSNMALAVVEGFRGDYAQCLELMKRAFEFDHPPGGYILLVGQPLLFSEEPEFLVDFIQRGIETEPEVGFIFGLQAYYAALAGQYDRAQAAAERSRELQDDNQTSLATQAVVYALSGKTEEARAIGDPIFRDAGIGPSGDLAGPYFLFLGELEAYLETMETAVEDPNFFTATSLRMLPFANLEHAAPTEELLARDRFWEAFDELDYPLLPESHRGYEAQQKWELRKAARAAIQEQQTGQQAEARFERIAVLPFDNLMNDSTQDYFADGMTDTLITELSKISALKVASRTSSMRYKDTTKTLAEIAEELNVANIVEGSVMRIADDVRITVKLIDATLDEPKWTETYDNTVDNVFKLHSDLALAIAGKVEAAIKPEERVRLSDYESIDPRAVDLYLQSRAIESTDFQRELARSTSLLKQALDIAPDFYQAWARLSNSHAIAAMSFSVMAPPLARIQSNLALEAASRANALAPNEPEGYRAQFLVRFLSGDWERAEIDADKIFSLDPHDAMSHFALGILDVIRGDYASGAEHLDYAYRQDPEETLFVLLAPAVAVAGRPEYALAVSQQAIDQNPDNEFGHTFLAFGAALAGQFDRSHAAMLIAAERLPDGHELLDGFSALAYGLEGRKDEARAVGDPLFGAGQATFLSYLAPMYFLLIGETDGYLAAMEQVVENPTFQAAIDLRVLPFADFTAQEVRDELLRQDRFWRLFDTLNFPPLPEDHPGYNAQQARVK